MATLTEVWAERGQTLHARQVLRKLLVSRFGTLTEAVEGHIGAADHATLDA